MSQFSHNGTYRGVTGNVGGIGSGEDRGSSSSRFQFLKQSLQTLARDIGAIDRELQYRIQATLAQLVDDTVSVTFGGHFSSGKSTLINAALGRSLLPTLDLPDTGAICVLQAGERDNVEVIYDRQRKRTIACTTTAIAEQISLRLASGMENTTVHQVETVNITLANSPIPGKAHWIDSPGINDSDEMLERASDAARKSDLLIWVLNSHQYLSLVEQDFIRNYVAERGPTSVVFAINVFLENDTLRDWNNYIANSFPSHMNKMRSVASGIGFTQAIPPEVVVVSARALCKYQGNQFGGRSLQSLLQGLKIPEHPWIRNARLFETAYVLQEVALSIRAKLQQEKERVGRAQAAFEQTRLKAEHCKKKFIEEVEKAIARFLADWRTSAHTSEKNIALTISSSTLRRDDTYSRNLSEPLKKAAAAGVENLLSRITAGAKLYEQRSLSTADIATIRQMLTPPEAVVPIPNTSSKPGKKVATVAAGAAIGGIVPGIGHLVGALAGVAVAGAVAYSAHNTAVQQDVAATQVNVTRATQSVIAAMDERGQLAKSFIIERCVNNKIFSSPSTAHLCDLEQWLQSISQLIEQVRSLARGV